MVAPVATTLRENRSYEISPGLRPRVVCADVPDTPEVVPDFEVMRRALDAVSDGIVIRSAPGAVVFRNAAAIRLLSGRSGPALTLKIACMVAALSPNGAAHVSEVEADGARYELCAGRVHSAAGLAVTLLVIRRVSTTLPSLESIAQRYGLTRREAMVARLLARGYRNDAISESLAISRSTARHYTESILLKLGTRSRGAAVALILGTTVATGEHAVLADRGSIP